MAANANVVKGKDGVVNVGTTAVGNLKEWTAEVTATQADTTVNGEDWMTTVELQNGWTANISGLYNPGDAAQAGLTAGSEIAVALYPQGAGTGNVQLTGQAQIVTFSRTGGTDNVATYTASLQGNGALTEGVQA